MNSFFSLHLKIKLRFSILILILSSQIIYAQDSVKIKQHPEWSYNQTIYEVNIRQYSAEGTFKAFEKDLPRLKELGVGIIWLMPVHPIGEKNRKGNLGSYYSVKDYIGINPEFGTMNDFKSLVNKIHDLGMYVIIDWVANHTAWDNALVEQHPEWYTKDSLGNFVPPVADWADVIDLNYDNKDLRNYMIAALKFWIDECNIDGYRCDVAGMVPLDFWLQAKNELNKVKNIFMLAEDENPETHAAFDMTYSWELFKTMNRISSGENDASAIYNLLNNEQTLYPPDAFRMRFTSNHDENTWNGTVFERLGDAAEAFAALTVLIPGMPLLYNGQEAGLNKRLQFFDKDTIRWQDHKFGEFYKSLFNLKKNSKVLQNGSRGGQMEFLSTAKDKNILSFVREKDNEKLLAIFNLSGNNTIAEINNSALKDNFKDFFSGEKFMISEAQSFNLKPWEYKIYITE